MFLTKKNNEIIAIVVNLLEDKRMSKKEHKQIYIKCNLIHEQKQKLL